MSQPIYVSDYGRAAVQNALDAAHAAGGGIVINNLPGSHDLDDILYIYSNTCLWSAPNVHYVRTVGGMTALLVIRTDGSGGYAGAYNVQIIGGDWNVNQAQHPQACAGIAFGHCHRVIISDLVVRNVAEWHALGIHGSRHVVVERCEFRDMVSSRNASEAVQVDAMYGAGAFGHYGPYDDTMCDGVTIRDCILDHNLDGIGSHNGPDGFSHRNIRIENNLIRNCDGIAIRPRQWEDVVITGNRIEGCLRAVSFVAEGNPPVRHGFHIHNNDITGVTAANDGVIWVQGNTLHWSGSVSDNHIGGAVCDGITLGVGIADWQLSCNTVAVDGAGLYTFNADRIVISGNRGFESDQSPEKGAVRVAAGSSNVIVTGNCVSRVEVANSDHVIVTGNITGHGVAVSGGSNVRAHHNFESGAWVA